MLLSGKGEFQHVEESEVRLVTVYIRRIPQTNEHFECVCTEKSIHIKTSWKSILVFQYFSVYISV